MNKQEYLALGAQRWYQGDMKGAYESYDQAIQLDSNYAEAYCGRGYALQDLCQYQAAFDDYSRAIGLNPELADAYINRATLRYQVRDFTDAIEDAERAAELFSIQGNMEGFVRSKSFVEHALEKQMIYAILSN